MTEFTSLPVIDLHPLIEHPSSQAADAVVQSIGQACREVGFFYVTGHGVSQELQDRMQTLAAQFFAQPEVSAVLLDGRALNPARYAQFALKFLFSH